MTKQKRGSKSGFISNLDVSFSMLNVAKKKWDSLKMFYRNIRHCPKNDAFNSDDLIW